MAVAILVIVLIGVVVVVLSSPVQEAPVAVPSPETTPAPPVLLEPLTGRALADPGLLDRPAVAVKVSDVRSAHPQVGVDRADIVFCEPIGVSYTRLAAVFHSDLPERVGPVRSARPMDAPILSPIAPVFAHTMAAEWVMTYLDSTAQVESLGSLEVPADAGAYLVDPARPAPDHVLVAPAVLLDLTQTKTPPEPYFQYAPTAAQASATTGAAATTVSIPYGPDWDVRWDYHPRSGQYRRAQPWGLHITADGTRISATNVLVLTVDSVTQKLAPGAGAPVPVLQLINSSGRLTAFAGGHAVHGTWSKGDVDDPFVLSADSGEPLLLAPGTTWVELPASGALVAGE